MLLTKAEVAVQPESITKTLVTLLWVELKCTSQRVPNISDLIIIRLAPPVMEKLEAMVNKGVLPSTEAPKRNSLPVEVAVTL